MKQSILHARVELSLFPKLIIGVLCLCLFTSCGDLFPSGKDDPLIIDAEILRIDVEPNPVQSGDTITLTCVLEDSLAENLLFVWGIPDNRNSIPTSVNEYSFVVDLAPGEYGGRVTVRDTTQSGVSPTEFFQITVVE